MIFYRAKLNRNCEKNTRSNRCYDFGCTVCSLFGDISFNRMNPSSSTVVLMSVLLMIELLPMIASSLSASPCCVRVPDDHLRLPSNLSDSPPFDRLKDEPLQLMSAGTKRDMKARSVGRQAHTIPTLASIIDQSDASRKPVPVEVFLSAYGL